MKRHIPGLQGQQHGLLEGTFLVGVNGASYPLASAEAVLLTSVRCS